MRKDIAKKWIKALRSGKYKKGFGYLKQYNSRGQSRHCCLGVLCELYNETMKKNHKKTLTVSSNWHDFDENNGFVLFNRKSGSLPKVVKNWAGIKDETGEFIYKVKDRYGEYKQNQNLSILNDTGSKFSTIANIIEKNVDNI
jgi:hypothetical protein